MSAYVTLMSPMIDEECLLAALTDLGFDRTKVEVHATPVPLVGYAGDARGQTANVVIRRRHLSEASNDMGFLSTPTGYRVLVSDYDRPRFGQDWLVGLTDRYQQHSAARQERLAAEERQRLEEARQKLVEAQRAAVHEKAKKMGYQVKETREGDTIRLVLIKRSY
jgi:hypothetical protein